MSDPPLDGGAARISGERGQTRDPSNRHRAQVGRLFLGLASRGRTVGSWANQDSSLRPNKGIQITLSRVTKR